ncbi:DUF4183 domain-containing protein [Paenibacillus planticolens]|uniref:DUF4183 domain-containing protein n=1 Tax=Paenibacillus planticolens TaxID=2654976 RepID=A0ABX1ZI61_9BACL|nr:DUF4183 domain-containing protein [Paenibacillus planticolens]
MGEDPENKIQLLGLAPAYNEASEANVCGVIHICFDLHVTSCSCHKYATKRRKKRPAKKIKHREIKYSARTYFFYAVSDGEKRVYTNEDQTPGYGFQCIPSPKITSYRQVFVNGVLQPRTLYRIRTGSLTLTSEDVPEKGVPIIVQSIRVYK